jgi:16S rRNA (cytosine1402-N4)-methyltransferase
MTPAHRSCRRRKIPHIAYRRTLREEFRKNRRNRLKSAGVPSTKLSTVPIRVRDDPVRPYIINIMSAWFREFRDKGERSTPQGEHVPILLADCVNALNPQPGQTIVDCTLGFAGHSVELLRRVGPTGRLIAFDADPTTIPVAESRLRTIGHPFHIHHGNFAGLPTALADLGVDRIDSLLADLGMSSMQVDDPSRGFSYTRDGPLDMRLDPTRGRTAAEILATLDEDDLAVAFRDLSDEPEAERIAAAIVRERKTTPLTTTAQLKRLVMAAAPVTVVKSPGLGPPEKQRMRPTMRVFQALRMLVNREIGNLEQLLRVLPDWLAPGGTAAIIAFHSGEDRLVKKAFEQGFRMGRYAKIAEEPIRPSEEEKAANPRSRSAKLRWATVA